MRALAAALLFAAGCNPVAHCRGQTVYVAVTLSGAAATADHLAVGVAIGSGPTKASVVAHTMGAATGGVEVDFPSGYPTGQTLTIRITALAGTTALGTAEGRVTATPGCATTMITVAANSITPEDMRGHGSDGELVTGSDGPTRDLAGSDALCIPAPENCFNGIDDDCNGLIDCADPACTPTASCVPAVADAIYGTLLPSGTCPQPGATAQPLYNNFSTAPQQCSGCLFEPMPDANTGIDVYSDDDGAACAMKPQSTLQGSVTWNAPCQSLTLYGQFQISNLRGKCSYYSGSPSLPSPPLTKNEFCASAATGTGCSPGNVCAPRVGSHAACVLTSAASCPASYPNASSWYPAYKEGRSCTACADATAISPSSGTVELFTNTTCSGTATMVSFSATDTNTTTTTSCTPSSTGGYSMELNYLGALCAINDPVIGKVMGMGAAETVCCK
jgi:hypothetical protein